MGLLGIFFVGLIVIPIAVEYIVPLRKALAKQWRRNHKVISVVAILSAVNLMYYLYQDNWGFSIVGFPLFIYCYACIFAVAKDNLKQDK